MGTYQENMTFESNVRDIAEAVWGLEQGACQPNHYPDDPVVREIDGMARLRDVTHLIMATTSTKLKKVQEDVKKLGAAEKVELKKAKVVSKWLITQSQIDAEHIRYARKNGVTVLTLDQFKRRFFDGQEYISKREVATFGSARNPIDNSVEISENAYVPLPMTVFERVNVKGRKKTHFEDRQSNIDVPGICELIEKGNIVILMAPFGSGKSLTGREIFRHLASIYRKGEGESVPISLNMREHWGQEFFDEILERHARSIGFYPKEDLVVAWRSGLTYMLLDGFDELASQGIVRNDDINFMREGRRIALTGIKDYFSKLPLGMGAFVSGRDHYFDNTHELRHAMGISEKNYKIVKLGEFTEEGANEFLRKFGFNFELPEWLPRKPLILSYLIQNELLEEILEVDSSEGYGYAWDSFIHKITQREADLERAVMDQKTLRNVMERLAFYVRSLPSGNGPITGNDLASTYSVETGQAAGEGVLAQLQRLPSLTQREQENGARSFVDSDMLSALQGGAIARIIWGDFGDVSAAPLEAVSERALDVAVYLLRRDGAYAATAFSVVERISKESKSAANKQLIADCFAVSLTLAREENKILDCRGLVVESASYGKLDLEDCPPSNFCFDNCIIDEVVIGFMEPENNISIRNCTINRVRGVANEAGLPNDVFDESCDVGVFDDIGTNSAVLQSDFEPQVKALLTILRKLYRQSGAGRKLSALRRGVTKKEVDDYIGPVLDVMEKQGFVRKFNQVAHPVRAKANRVENILNAPSISQDELVEEIRGL